MKPLSYFQVNRQAGVSLIEVMVAVFVLSVGLLGVAALMGNALQFNQGAQARTQAVLLASDIIERARVNRTNVNAYAIANTNGDCTSIVAGATVAAWDMSEWLRQVGCALPGGSAQIAVAGGQMTVTLQWADTTDNSQEQLVVQTQLQ